MLASLGAADQRLGRRIHHFDFVGFEQKFLRHAVGRALAGDALHRVLLLADVLQVDRGDDRDAAIEQLLHVLPAMRIAAARRIVERQAVDQARARMPAENGRQVDHVPHLAGMLLAHRRDDFEIGQDGLQIGRQIALQGADHHVLPALLAAAPLVEHAERFAHARRVAEEDLQAPAPFPPLAGLHAAQQLFRVRPAIGAIRHKNNYA